SGLGTPPRLLFQALELDLDIDASGEIELHQSIDRLRGRVHDIKQPLVRAHFELLAALLVDVRRAVDSEFFDPRRQRNRAANVGAGAPGRRHDFTRRGIEHTVVKRFQADADVLSVHASLPCSGAARAFPAPATDPLIRYSTMLATMPAPTVRPPSRMAKRSFSSMAIGTISSTSTVTLSPGITI